jgi:hypothetical protein
MLPSACEDIPLANFWHAGYLSSATALGMVYKLVEINDVPRIKLSQDVAKVCDSDVTPLLARFLLSAI